MKRGGIILGVLLVQACIIFAIGKFQQLGFEGASSFSRRACEAPPGQNAINGIVFEDDNSDGIQNGMEVGYNGVTVRLFADTDSNNVPDGAALQTVTTDTVGEYQFDTTLVFSQFFIYNQRIQSSSDDAHEDGGKAGPVDVNNNDIKFGKAGDEPAGFRFTNVDLPSGSTINSAFMYVNNGAGGKAGGPVSTSVDIYAEDVSNPSTFVNQNNDISGRALTSNAVQFDIDWDDGDTAVTPDLAAIIQELVDDHGAVDEVAFVFESNGSSDDEIKVVSFDDSNPPNKSARLFIDYSVNGNGAYHFLTDVDMASFLPGQVLTTSTYQAAAFYASDIADCNNDFGIYTGNKSPVAVDDQDSTLQDFAVIIIVVTNDSDPNDNLNNNSISIVNAAVNGTTSLNIDTTGFQYLPDPGFYGWDSFTYSICDFGTPALCDTANVVVYVACRADSVTIDSTICVGAVVNVGSSSYSTAGTHITNISRPFCDSVVTLNLTVEQLPSNANAGGDQTQCNTSSFTMSANVPIIGTGSWTLVSGIATITSSSSPTTTVTGITVGNNATLRWSIVNGICNSSTDDITIQNDAVPSASAAGLDQTLCNTSIFTLSANTPSIGSGTWSIISGIATITSPSSPNTTVTGVAIGETIVLRWTISNGVCSSSADDVSIFNDGLVGGVGNEITGIVYYDQDSSSTLNGPDVNYQGATVLLYDDTNNDGIPDGPSLTSTTTDAGGAYTFDTVLVYSQAFIYNQRIQSSSDDAHEDGGKAGPVELTNNDVKFGAIGDDPAGFKFNGLNLPGNATINNAFMYINNGESKAGTDISSVDISAEDIASPSTFVNAANNISNRVLTTNKSQFDINWDVGDTATSPNLGPIVQELVNSYGAINEIAFIFEENGLSSNEIKVVSWNDDPSNAARLNISYNVPGNGPYYFLTEVVNTTLPATSLLTTSQYQSAVFYQSGIEDCSNDFGFYIVDQNPNSFPLAVNDIGTTNYDVAIIVDVLLNDSDPDIPIQNITISEISSMPNQGGTAIINNNGTPFDPTDDYIDFNPSGVYVGSESFSYVICDNGYPSLCDTALVNLTITSLPNYPPFAVNDTVATIINVPSDIDILGNDFDSTGTIDISSIAIVSLPSFGVINNINPLTGVITYTPNTGASGTDLFTYVVCDNGFPVPVLCDTATVFVDIISYIPNAILDTFHTGSVIIDMNVQPQTFGNGLKPYGLVYELVNTYNIPISWSINANKESGGIDFSLGNKDYSGGPFIIPAEYRSAAIDVVITNWRTQGVVADVTDTLLIVPIVQTINGFNNLILDQENFGITTPYFVNAGIPSSIYTIGNPTSLNDCSDVFVLPHANPTWPGHQYIYDYVTEHGGYVYAACRAVSILESLFDPADSTKQLNFLSEAGLQCYGNGGCNHINEVHSPIASQPYLYDSTFAAMPLMQFMDDIISSTENGSEQWYIPIDNTNWNPGAVVMVSTADVNSIGAKGTKFAFGYAYDDPKNGMEYYHGGHRLNQNDMDAQVAGQRAFFNFLFTSIRKVAGNFSIKSTIPKTCYGPDSIHPVSAEVLEGNNGPYTYSWTTTVDGTFANSSLSSTTFKMNANPSVTQGIITVTITDACGRSKFESTPLNKMTIEAVTANESCYAGKDGSIDLTVESDCTPINYLWDSGETTEDLDSVYSGTHIVQITDALGYQVVKWFVLDPPDRLETCIGGFLPIELATFYGENEGDINHLFWTTLSEINNDYFNIQRSQSGVEFEDIGQIRGAGTVIDPQDYDFIDLQPNAGNNYYRLQQVDYDGTSSYSQIINLHNANNTKEVKMLLWPNPTDGGVTIDLIGDLFGDKLNFRIFDITGTIAVDDEIEISDENRFTLDLNGLTSGIYMIEIWNNHHLFSQKVIVK